VEDEMVINRKLKSLDNKTGKKILARIQDIIDTNERYKNCYFWTSNKNASGRRAEEFERYLKFFTKDDEYTIHQSLDISCRNYYYRLSIMKNGRKSNITILKNILKKYS
jgi:hypothetical protein